MLYLDPALLLRVTVHQIDVRIRPDSPWSSNVCANNRAFASKDFVCATTEIAADDYRSKNIDFRDRGPVIRKVQAGPG
jgi:hypothetical protein